METKNRTIIRELAGGYLLAGAIVGMCCLGYWYLDLLYGKNDVKVYPELLFVITVVSPVIALCIPRLCYRSKRSGWFERRWVPLGAWWAINAAYFLGRYFGANSVRLSHRVLAY